MTPEDTVIHCPDTPDDRDTSHLKTYREAVEYQLQEWLAGRPWHNPFDPDDTRHDGDTGRGECCPDFSCCAPHMMASEEARRAFAISSCDARMGMLFGFLGGLVQEVKPDPKADYLAGDPDVEKSGDLQ
jgi:hypothetical protein